MAGVNDRGFFRKSTGHTLARKHEQKKREPLPTHAAVHTYVAAMQGLMQRQAHALVNRFGCDPMLPDVVRQLWFAYLPLSGVLEKDFAECERHGHCRPTGCSQCACLRGWAMHACNLMQQPHTQTSAFTFRSFEDKFELTLPSETEEGGDPDAPSQPQTQTNSWQFYSSVMSRALGPVRMQERRMLPGGCSRSTLRSALFFYPCALHCPGRCCTTASLWPSSY